MVFVIKELTLKCLPDVTPPTNDSRASVSDFSSLVKWHEDCRLGYNPAVKAKLAVKFFVGLQPNLQFLKLNALTILISC
jgi:hypothetical protein